ncbi:alpha/beta hydrolase [Algiphilus sp.]|uniref:alpha/beta hydrolase n=1 Tax=Algiphilus sp. TaxID=1872431 RepID=UPI003B52089E
MTQQLPAPGARETVFIDGEAGAIEAVLSTPRGAPARGALLVCHPHPLYGGTMDNKVVTTLAAAAHDAGMAALRFNFRGVGASEGAHDAGQGETRDCLRVAEWLRHRLAGEALALAGFSFGGYVALAAQADIAPAALITVAPATRYFQGIWPQWPTCPWLCIHAKDDDVVPYEATHTDLQAADPPPQWSLTEEGGHFFHGQLQAVRAPARACLEGLVGG